MKVFLARILVKDVDQGVLKVFKSIESFEKLISGLVHLKDLFRNEEKT